MNDPGLKIIRSGPARYQFLSGRHGNPYFFGPSPAHLGIGRTNSTQSPAI